MSTEKLGPRGGSPGRDKTVQDGKQPQVDSALQGNLGRKLREVYQEVVNEDVPSKFLDLLSELKKREAGGDQQ